MQLPASYGTEGRRDAVCPVCGDSLAAASFSCAACELSDSRPEAGPASSGSAASLNGQLTLEPERRYQVLAELGRGSMGVIYKIRDRELDEVIALKVLAPQDPQAINVEQFKQEIKLARRINHPNVARVYDLVLWHGRLAITQEYIEGRTLSEVLTFGPLPPGEIRKLVRPLCSALGAAHALGVVHRDLKPANIILDEPGQPRILDFGLAMAVGDVSSRSFEQVTGTPLYMAPEQAFAPSRVDHRSDIYSLGVVLFHMATGRPPFPGGIVETLRAHRDTPPPRPRQLNPQLPEALEEVILKCLEKQPARRYQSPLELHAELETLWAHEEVSAPELRIEGKLLVIDDDDDLREWIRLQLEPHACEVLEAGDGAAGIELALSERPRLILMDLKMPLLDGQATLRILKRNARTRSIPVVMITGHSEDEQAIASKAAGAAAFLNKPIQTDILELLAARYLGRSQ